ncbi:hypothetical protein [Goodfellowiella coeruleoviolacea]|uniref:hypothetical protein n=1 Tax=Goodfellowiella coeruleoviolacea TaxID=334858 RepID=UPI0020A514B3|nr:hypothetical protein [Goodfellowiella coeruleoviolacea]
MPTIRVASLADLGEYLDPDGDIWPTDEFHDDPHHQPGCDVSLNATSTTTRTAS